jgi:hypothetical protein
MRKVLAVTLFFSSQILWAQALASQRQHNYTTTEGEQRLQQHSFEEWATQPEAARQAAARSVADAKLLEFCSKARRFVELWKKLSDDLNDRKTFNVKLAKQVSKAFHDLEKSEGWPAELRK